MSLDPITIDFETEAINGNPILNPPRPVGVSIWVPGQEPTYLAWGHPTGNTTDFATARAYLQRVWEANQSLLFHNAGFDLSVWDSFIFPIDIKPRWGLIHDTMYLLFLADPYSHTLSLKPSADRYLGMAATEQSELYDWILANVPGATLKTAGAYIALAPGDLVGRYAIGDVVRTRRLFDLLYLKIEQDGMLDAYRREQRLFPITVEGTRRGIRVDRDKLQHDQELYSRALDYSGIALARTLGCSVEHLDHDESFADALTAAGAVKEWVLTPTGKRSLSKDNLHIEIPEVKSLMLYRGALTTCLQTFIRPWLEFSKHDGRLHPNWNQVRQSRSESGIYDSKGTRTGRLSSDSPNFQNVPTEFTDSLGNPLVVPEGLPNLPIMRGYCLPEHGHVWLKRDFSSQEIRILAHFEDGNLLQAYRGDPSLDPHQMSRTLIHEMIGVLYARKDVKITGFSIIYGTGARGLSIQLNRTITEAASIKAAYLAAMPGLRDLQRGVQNRGKSGQPIRTWGGRVYYVEPPRIVDGRTRDFAYKLLNYLIQGSAADQTKEAINHWDDHRHPTDTFLATVHDEINISAPIEDAEGAMNRLKTSMELERFDCPMLSEGFMGPNWGDIE